MELYRHVGLKHVSAYLCVLNSTYRAVWLGQDTTTFKLETIILPTASWYPLPNEADVPDPATYELVDTFATLKECHEYLSLLELLED